MNETQAFEILGLQLTSSEDEINSRFRDLSKQLHPDIGGVDYDMSELSVARETAIAAIQNRSLVPIATIREIVQANTNAIMKKQELQAVNMKIVNQIVRHQTNRFKRYKRIAAICGSISTGMIAITSNFLGDLSQNLESFFYQIPILYFFYYFLRVNPFYYILFTALIGLGYYIATTVVENIERAIEDFNDMLDDNSIFVTFFQMIFRFSNINVNQLWTKTQLEHFVNNWVIGEKTNQHFILKLFDQLLKFSVIEYFFFPSSMNHKELARFIGVLDFVKLLISKGLEKEIIIEHHIMEDGIFLVQYSFTFVQIPRKEARKVRNLNN